MKYDCVCISFRLDFNSIVCTININYYPWHACDTPSKTFSNVHSSFVFPFPFRLMLWWELNGLRNTKIACVVVFRVFVTHKHTLWQATLFWPALRFGCWDSKMITNLYLIKTKGAVFYQLFVISRYARHFFVWCGWNTDRSYEFFDERETIIIFRNNMISTEKIA